MVDYAALRNLSKSKMKKGVILIIDDEIEILGLLSRFLKRRGFVVHTADNLKKGKAQFEITQPEFVFLDVNLPDGNGLRLLSDLKNITLSVKVIMMSAINDDEIKTKASALGAMAFLNKPFTFEAINQLIN